MSSSRPPTTTNPTALVVTTGVIAAILVLLGIGLFWLALQRGAALWPAPTPTPTAGPTRTPTPDRRATFVAEDMLTQAAFTATAAIIGAPEDIPTPTAAAPAPPAGDATPVEPVRGGSTIALLPIIIAGMVDLLPTLPAPPPNPSVFVPSVSAGPGTPTPDPLMPTATLNPLAPTNTPDPLAPTATTIPGGLPTETPTPPPPTPTFTPSPTFTPAPLTLSEMPATVRIANAPVHVGPSAVYTQITTLNEGTPIRLRGRTAPGDWLYACCLPGDNSFWIRPAYVNVNNTVLPTAVPTNADPLSLRWLALQAPDPVLTPRPVPSSIPPGDFPLARYDAANTGRVPMLPSGGLTRAWTENYQTGNAFLTPPVVLGTTTVVFYNSDGDMYSLFWDAGNQRWRNTIRPEIRFAPALFGNVLYVLNGSTVSALQDQGGAAALVGQAGLPNTPQTPITIWLNMLLVGVGDGGDARLVALRRDNLGDPRFFDTPSGTIQLPAIGQETIYVGADRLYAIDANLFDRAVETIWIDPTNIGPITAPPVYAYPGILALAELYVASGNRVFALDANTGARIWSYDFGGPVTALAVNERSVVIVGNNQMHLVNRDQPTRDQVARQWGVNVNGAVMGGPLITDRFILLVTQNGGIFLHDIANGIALDASQSVPAGVVGGPAVSNGRIFIASGVSAYAFQGNP